MSRVQPVRPRPRLREVALFAEAVMALAVAAALVRFFPFRTLVRTLGWGGKPSARIADRAEIMAADIALAVERASRRVPWRSVCIHRGLALQWMARRRGLDARFHYGLAQERSVLSAHVWVSLDSAILIGASEAATYACVAEFPPVGEAAVHRGCSAPLDASRNNT